MNVDGTFGRAVLAGLRKQGLSDLQIRQMSGVRPATLKMIRAGKRGFSAQALSRLERATGLDAGQIAAHALESGGGALTEFMNGWAEVRALFPEPTPAKATDASGRKSQTAGRRTIAATPAHAPRARSA